MSKSIEFTQSQIKAKENRATMFMFPIIGDNQTLINKIVNSKIESAKSYSIGKFIQNEAPLQIGDKDIYVKEEFTVSLYDNGLVTGSQFAPRLPIWQPASQMTKEQSRYTINEVIDIRVVRVKDCIYDYSTILERLEIGKIKKFGVKYHVPKSFMGHEQNAKDGFVEYYNTQLKEQNISRTYEDNDYVFLIKIRDK